MDMQRFPVELGRIELVDADDAAITQYAWSKSVTLTIAESAESGWIDLVTLTSTGGDILQPTGQIMFFDATPAIAAADTNITAVEAATVIDFVDISASDWWKEGGGASVCAVASVRPVTPIPFHHVTALYVAFYNTGATTINSAAGDNEELWLNTWVRKSA